MQLLTPMRVTLTASTLLLLPGPAMADPDQTVRVADQVLHEVILIPGRQIPERLLAEAQGIAIIPRVIKIGFIAGVRRGHGVMLVRDAEGEWSLPQFITLTGGSVGWQAGVEGTDVVLVFMTKKSVEGMLRGKFTIGADASVAAGPIGRDAAAATDARLKAEILSYSRSRGLVRRSRSMVRRWKPTSMAKSATTAPHLAKYLDTFPKQLRGCQDLVQMTAAAGVPLAPAAGASFLATRRLKTMRHTLSHHAKQLYDMVDEPWQESGAFPRKYLKAMTRRPTSSRFRLRCIDLMVSRKTPSTNFLPCIPNSSRRTSYCGNTFDSEAKPRTQP